MGHCTDCFYITFIDGPMNLFINQGQDLQLGAESASNIHIIQIINYAYILLAAT